MIIFCPDREMMGKGMSVAYVGMNILIFPIMVAFYVSAYIQM